MKEVISVKNVNKTYQAKNGEVVALDGIDFTVRQGEFIAIIGPSGCGKSTLLSIIAGLEEKNSGEIKINGEIGYMLQKDSLLEWRTIYHNVMLGLEIRKAKTKENIEYVENLLRKYHLYEFKDKYPAQLSGGMRQRVALIRTLATNPDILLLDEPFSSLDYISRLKLSDDIYQIIKEEGKTAIIVTHDIQEAIALADRVIVLTKRPATIKKEYKIHLTDKSTPFQNRKCKEFNDYYDAIWRDLNET